MLPRVVVLPSALPRLKPCTKRVIQIARVFMDTQLVNFTNWKPVQLQSDLVSTPNSQPPSKSTTRDAVKNKIE